MCRILAVCLLRFRRGRLGIYVRFGLRGIVGRLTGFAVLVFRRIAALILFQRFQSRLQFIQRVRTSEIIQVDCAHDVLALYRVVSLPKREKTLEKVLSDSGIKKPAQRRAQNMGAKKPETFLGVLRHHG